MKKIKTFIINLARSPARREEMQGQIKALLARWPDLNLDFAFFEAIDGASYPAATDPAAHPLDKFKNKWSDFKSTLILQRPLSSGEKACWASHYTLWEECVRLGEAIIVLEDDVFFSEDFLARAPEIIEEIRSSGFDYVRLFYCFDRFKIYSLRGPFHLSFEDINGTQGYFLRPAAAVKFLKMPWLLSVDNAMDGSNFNGVLNIIHLPFCVLAGPADSTIAGREGPRKKIHLLISYELYQVYRRLHRLGFIITTLIRLKKYRALLTALRPNLPKKLRKKPPGRG